MAIYKWFLKREHQWSEGSGTRVEWKHASDQQIFLHIQGFTICRMRMKNHYANKICHQWSCQDFPTPFRNASSLGNQCENTKCAITYHKNAINIKASSTVTRKHTSYAINGNSGPFNHLINVLTTKKKNSFEHYS